MQIHWTRAVENLEDIIDGLLTVAPREDGRVYVGDIMHALGTRSFGPVLLVPGLIGLSPIGAIPFVPLVTSAIDVIIAAEILMRFHHFWIPDVLANRRIDQRRFQAGLHVIYPTARVVDRFLFTRFKLFTDGPAAYVIAFLIFLVSLVTPIIELVPLAGIVPNAAIVAFALALTAHDGLWAILAGIFTLGTVYLAVSFIMG
jgi:hypothetical protein